VNDVKRLKRCGIFITFEGPDGSGKSTQIKLLADYFSKLGKEYITTREPGGTKIGEKLRNILKDNNLNNVLSIETEVLLLQTARAQHVHELIKPALEEGKIVICDRFADSSVAYQGAARGVGVKKIDSLNRFSTTGLQPDITILLDIPAKKSLERSEVRQEETDRWEVESQTFHEKVRRAYLKLAMKFPERIKIVPAEGSVHEVHCRIVNVVKAALHA